MKKKFDLWVRSHPVLKKLITQLKIAFFIVVVSGANVFAAEAFSDLQQFGVTGKITDSQTGDPMPGVNILVKGTTFGAISDIEGKYTLSTPDRKAPMAV